MGGGEKESRRSRSRKGDTEVGGAVEVDEETVNTIETDLTKRGGSKRPRLHHQEAKLRPKYSNTDLEKDINGSGSNRVGAEGEVGAGAEEETSQGGLEVPAYGNHIFKENPTQNNFNKKKKMGTPGGMEGGQSRGEKGYGVRDMGGKQLWDPGSSQD